MTVSAQGFGDVKFGLKLERYSGSAQVQTSALSLHASLPVKLAMGNLLMRSSPSTFAVTASFPLPRCGTAVCASAELELMLVASKCDAGELTAADGCTAAECILRANLSALLAAGRMKL